MSPESNKECRNVQSETHVKKNGLVHLKKNAVLDTHKEREREGAEGRVKSIWMP